jgi:hypothetical protein
MVAPVSTYLSPEFQLVHSHHGCSAICLQVLAPDECTSFRDIVPHLEYTNAYHMSSFLNVISWRFHLNSILAFNQNVMNMDVQPSLSVSFPATLPMSPSMQCHLLNTVAANYLNTQG